MKKFLLVALLAFTVIFSGCTIKNELNSQNESSSSSMSEETFSETSDREVANPDIVQFVNADGEVVLDARDIELAEAQYVVSSDGKSEPVVQLTLTEIGADRFAEATKDAAISGTAISIFVDSVCVSTPMVSSEYAETGITGGVAIISGDFTYESALQLSETINQAIYWNE